MLKSSVLFFFTSLCTLSFCFAEESPGLVAEQIQNDMQEPQPVEAEPIQNNMDEPQPVEEECCQGPRRIRADVRYTSPTGIGYGTGYTTLEAFFAPQTETWVPFVDLRGHVFDNGRFAANAGLGLRYVGQSRVYGANVYYDYRNTKRENYNQIAAGLETLGKVWDFRINGYLPVGTTNSGFFNPKFAFFKGHSMYIRRSRDFAMKGFNAEAGAHYDHFENAPLYFAAGPYYLTGVGKSTWGGQFRAAVDLFHRHLRIEGNTAYDHFFKWTGQGQLSLNVFFGGKKKLKSKGCQTCSDVMTLANRAAQRIDRMEIIPVGRHKKTELAIDPATGLPVFAWFVNNTSHSAGTFESPFPTFAQAQAASSPNQIIYVFPGDGTTQGMDTGITLQNGQYLLSSSVKQSIPTTKGTVHIPATTFILPNITGTPTGNAVTLANNNTVSGFYIIVNGVLGGMLNGNGISGNGISNFTSNQNIFTTVFNGNNGINLINPTGQVIVKKNIFNGFNKTGIGNFSGNGIYLELNTGTLSSLNVTSSSFSNISGVSFTPGGNGIFARIVNGTLVDGNISNCSFNNFSSYADGILFDPAGGLISNVLVSGCSFNNFSNVSNGVFCRSTMSGTIANLQVADCAFNTFLDTSGGILISAGGGTIANLDIIGSTFNNINSGVGISIATTSPLTNSNVTDCTFNNIINFSSGIVVESGTGGPIANTNISNCIFTNITDPTSNGIIVSNFNGGALPSVNISNNTFTGSSTISAGYAAEIQIYSDTTCLNFTYNQAAPTNTPAPYLFQQTGGTFNRTTGSDGSTNVGSITTTGTVGPPGSCSQ